jgi:hypothetical protein
VSLPPDAVSKARTWFAEMRKLVQYPSPTDRVCPAEEALVKLLERELRAPTGLGMPDGFPAGGSGSTRGSASSTTTEAAVLGREVIRDAIGRHNEDRNVRDNRLDTIGPVVLDAWDFTEQAGRSARIVRDKITEAEKLSKQRQSLGRTVAVCCEEGCESIAVTTDKSKYPGRCDADRQWLEHDARKAESEGRDPVRVVPREVIEARDNPPKRHDQDTEETTVDRLLSRYEGA